MERINDALFQKFEGSEIDLSNMLGGAANGPTAGHTVTFHWHYTMLFWTDWEEPKSTTKTDYSEDSNTSKSTADSAVDSL